MLSNKQIELIKNCWAKGYVNYEDVRKVYTSSFHMKEVFEHLISLGILKEDKFSFKIDRDRFIEIQNEIFNS